jgi:putative ABC transport system permease protein
VILFIVVLVLGVPLLIGVGLLLWDAVFRPSFRRLALRNVRSRPGEALLVVLGALFGTAIIAASFVVGDSFDGSIRAAGQTRLGPIDVQVAIRPAADLDHHLAELHDQLAHTTLPGTDGMLSAKSTTAVLSNGRTGDALKADSSGCVLGVDFAEGRRFGADPSITGLADAGATPTGSNAVINERLARNLELSEGDRLTIYANGRAHRFDVQRIVPEVGLAGYCGAMVAPGAINELATPLPPGSQPPAGLVWISNTGGVYDSIGPTSEVMAGLRARLSDTSGVDISAIKRDTLDTAEKQGKSLRTLFSAIGGFSVAAGILLLVNLFVMLAEERKVGLGMLRAVGMKRNHVFRSFSLEGAIYSVAAAVLGALVGVGVGWLIILGTAGIFRDPTDEFRIDLYAKPTSLLIAAAIGCGISLLTVWGTSLRISRLNVISAIRDLPDPRRRGRRTGALLLGVAGVLLGGVLFALGVTGDFKIGLLAGPAVATFSAMSLLSRVLPTRLVRFVLCAAVIVWSINVFQLFPHQLDNSGIDVFVTMGLTLVFAAVIIATTLDRLWGWLTLQMNEHGRGLAPRLGLAYPLSRGFRTGMILAMYSLVIFTMTFVGAFSAILGTQTAQAATDMAAGFDLIVNSNSANPVTTAQLERQPGVADAVSLTRGNADFTISRYEPSPTAWDATGIDQTFLRYGTPMLSTRDHRFASDQAAFDAVISDPSLIIVDDSFLQDGGGPKGNSPRPGDQVVMINGAGKRHAMTVAGVLRTDFTNHGSLMQRQLVRDFLAPATTENRHMVRVAPGHDPRTVAKALTTTLVANGATAQTFEDRVTEVLSRQTSFIGLMQLYLGFGLLIGIAGLGVVMVRAVRERRREIGMLRAMGFSASVVRRAWLVEATFIAVQAVATGVGLGLVTAYQVAVNSNAFSNATLSFTVSGLSLAAICVVPIVASLLATVAPARRAARIRPATALRIAE